MKVFDFFGSYQIGKILNLFPNIGLATSVRLLDDNYTGGLLRVRAWDGSSDKGQADVLHYNGWVDMNSLLTNLDANATNRGLTTASTLADLVDVGGANYDGLVPKINDQTGSGNDYIQTIAALQGRLINGGVMNLLNGKPVILRSESPSGGYLSQFNPNTGATNKGFFYVGDNGFNIGASTAACLMSAAQGGQTYSYYINLGYTFSVVNAQDYSPTNEILNGIAFIYTDRDDSYEKTKNQFILNNYSEFKSNFNTKGLGYRFDNPNFFGMFSFQEELIWLDTNDMTAKESNINNSFNVF